MGDASIKGRSPLLKGGRVGFSRAGPVGNLPWVRGTSRPGVKKAPRGAEHKEAIKQERIYVKADRDIIPGKKTPVSYTKSRWKNWKKSKTEQYKRKKEYVEAGKQKLQAKYPDFKFKSKGGKV
jgi:hypothetical protein